MAQLRVVAEDLDVNVTGILSDIHGNIDALNAVLDEMEKAGVTRVVFAGDAVGYYPYANEVIDRLRAADAVCVLGNHDAALLGMITLDPARHADYRLAEAAAVLRDDNRAWLEQVPLQQTLALDHGTALLAHGSPWDPLEEYVYPDHGAFHRFDAVDADWVILGHTHWQMLHRREGISVLNPGSCGQPRDYVPGASYALLDSAGVPTLHRADYPIDEFASDLRDRDLPPALIDILYRRRHACPA